MARYPLAQWKPSPNCSAGRGGQVVRAVVLHITAGPVGNEFASAVGWFANPASQVSAHFVVNVDGGVAQCVDTADMAWANGISKTAKGWINPQGHIVKPTWPLLTTVNPNLQTISIEHAGQSNMPHSPAQINATIALLRWLGTQYPALSPYVAGRTLIRHADLDPVDRPNCPGPLFNLEAISSSTNLTTPRKYRVKSANVYQRQTLDGPLAAQYPSGTPLDIDMQYPNGAGHVATGIGFVDMRDLEEI